MINRTVWQEEALAKMVDGDAFLEIAPLHLGEVVLETFIVAEQDRSALHLAVGRRIFLVYKL